MSLGGSRWDRLCSEIEGARQDNAAHSVTALQNSLVRRLKALSERGHCSPNSIGRIDTIRGQKQRVQLTFKKDSRAHDGREHPAVLLSGLTYLEDGALLTVSIELDSRRNTLLSYSVSIRGMCRAAPAHQPWFARIDLTEHAEGQGTCAHPMLHCHIGHSPEDHSRDQINPRAPLPWLSPGDALDWLLATVEPALEPARLSVV